MAFLSARRALCAACLTIAFAPSAMAQGLEYEVKAAFLYNFTKFVEWPPDALRSGEPFRICLIGGEDPFGGRLERTVAGDSVDGHPIVVERLPVDAAASCQIVFVPRSQVGHVGALVRAVGRTAVLTVGESPAFLQAGGLINLVVDGGRVRFDVNIESAASRGLHISSKLLRVARNTGGSHDREQR
jgi:hypothetical protein